jgi:hypothetical protein
VLTNAPQLVGLDVHSGFTPLKEVAGEFTGKIFPRLKVVKVRTPEEGLFSKVEEILAQVLRKSCPQATIHISVPGCCKIYYGVGARLFEQAANVEPESCDDPDHVNDADDDDDGDDYDDEYYDDDDYNQYMPHIPHDMPEDEAMLLAFEYGIMPSEFISGRFNNFYEDDD